MNYPARVRLVRTKPVTREKSPRPEDAPEEMLKCSHREAGADFYCWRFKLWYNTLDCAYRTKHGSYDGCLDCAQGNFNLRVRARDLKNLRYLGSRKP